MKQEKRKRTKEEILALWRGNIIWIIVVFLGIYYFTCPYISYPWYLMLYSIEEYVPSGFVFIMELYTCTIIDIFVLFLLTWLIKPNRYIWKSFLFPKKKSSSATVENDIPEYFYGRNNNTFKVLGWGLLIGFLMNGFTIACAYIHKDISINFEVSVQQIPLLLFGLFSVLIQSSSEELWCRGFLYERLHERHPLWVAVLVNGIMFGILHIFNDGASVLSIIVIALSGISFSLLRWYSGNIWITIGAHAGWNITQAFLFGLPNSGFVSEVSLFHANASGSTSNLIYDYVFGVEGGIPALLIYILLIVIVIVLAARSGRLKELKMNRARTINESKAALEGAK